MKIKAILFAAAIFGATFFVTENTNNNNDKENQEQAVERSKLKIPAAG